MEGVGPVGRLVTWKLPLRINTSLGSCILGAAVLKYNINPNPEASCGINLAFPLKLGRNSGVPKEKASDLFQWKAV
jgi:hypothetical protein